MRKCQHSYNPIAARRGEWRRDHYGSNRRRGGKYLSRLLKNWAARLTLEHESDSCAVERAAGGIHARFGYTDRRSVFLCRSRTESARKPSTAIDPAHRQRSSCCSPQRIWQAVRDRRAALDRPRAAATSAFAAGVLQHPLGAPVDGTIALQSALSLVYRSRRG